MSQNTTTLLLFFEQEQAHKDCLLMLLKLEQSNFELAKQYAQRLNIDISATWKEDWFNQSISAKSDHICITYDSSTRYHLPLPILQELFSCGLKGAALEVFFDQVGEYAQHYFFDEHEVLRKQFISEIPDADDIATKYFECSPGELEETISALSSISDMQKNEAKHTEDSQEMVSAMLSIARLAKDSDSNPIETLKNVLVLRAAGKGLLQTLAFATCTILLFKGIWLWISLSLLLAIFLPLYYVSKVSEEFSDDMEEEGEAVC